MNIAIIGGGITGLAIAYYLSKQNKVIVFDKNPGGLVSAFKINDAYLEKYYHHFFKSDKYLLELISELNLNDKILWKESKVAFYFKNNVYNLNTAFDLLSFKPLKFINRIKLGLFILNFRLNNNWKRFDNKTIKEFCKNNKNIYNTIWKPLSRIKFGRREDISAAFLWGRLNPRSKSRSKGKEILGYLNGSYKILTDRLIEKIKEKNSLVVPSKVEKIKKINDKFEIIADKNYTFDKVIITAQIPQFIDMFPSLPELYKTELNKIEYNSILCVILKLKNKISNYYWLNNIDPNLTLGGVIEHTNLISKNKYGGNIVYLFNYLSKDNPLYNLNNNHLIDHYLKELKKIFPNFNKDDIINYYIFKDDYATPIYIKNYSKIMPNIKTPVKNLYLANISQIYPYDRNINHSIKLARLAANAIEKDI